MTTVATVQKVTVRTCQCNEWENIPRTWLKWGSVKLP